MKSCLRAFIYTAVLGAFTVACSEQTVELPLPTETEMTRTNNHIDYVEFAAEDLEVFKKFYGEAFGWEFQDWGPEYISFSGAGIDGGVNGGKAPVVGSTTIILYADDLQKSEAAVVKAGGEITERHEFPGGKRFHFRDPTGNELAVWKIVEGTE